VPDSAINQPDQDGRHYLDVIFRPTDGHHLNVGSILDGAAEFTLLGPASAGVTVGQPIDLGGGVFRYPLNGNFSTGQVTLHFLAGSWTDDGSPNGTPNQAQADQSFNVYSGQSKAFQVHLGSPQGTLPGTPESAIVLLQAPENLLSEPLVNLS